MLKLHPELELLILVTDCSGKEFKAISAFFRLWQQVAKKFNKNVLVCQFARLKGKFLYDGYGKRWEVEYLGYDEFSKFALTGKVQEKCCSSFRRSGTLY